MTATDETTDSSESRRGPSAGERVHVLVGAAAIDGADQRRLAAAFPEVRFTFAATAEAATAAAPSAEVIFAKGFPAGAVAAARRLRWVQAGTAGVETWLRLLEGRDVLVTNARGAHGIPLAENILAMALCFATRMHLFLRTQRERARIGRRVVDEKWELHGQTLLVVGLGDIGGTLALKAAALGMRVVGVRRTGAPHPHCEAVYPQHRLADVLPQADHVALCLPLTGQTRAIVGERELRLMRPTAHIYNVGRGASIDGAALRRALAEGWIAGAGLDCVAPADVPADDDPLWDMENVILSMHTGGSSPANSRRISDIFADNLRRYLDGRPLVNAVDREQGY